MFTKLSILLLAVSFLFEAEGQTELDGPITFGYETTVGIQPTESAPIQRTPYQVSVEVNGNQICAGAIYSRRIIITAAHCVIDQDARALSIRVGSDNYYYTTSSIPLKRVSKKVVHEQYSDVTSLFDIALLLLSSPLKFGANVKPIPLACSEPTHGATAIVSCWGENKCGCKPKYLQNLNVSVVERDLCIEAYHNDSITEATICAVADGKESCQSVSGGPLVHNKKLVGIVSWGNNCADTEHPGVYVNIATLRFWIVEQANKLLSRNRK